MIGFEVIIIAFVDGIHVNITLNFEQACKILVPIQPFLGVSVARI